MKNILLVCAAGMSTSLMVNKMQAAAKNRDEEISINATAGGNIDKYGDQADVLLLGPQISYQKDEYVNKYEPKGIPVAVIDTVDYGLMNGEKVLDQALQMIKEK
ncbi:PTS sugar transporter subunit IIB [Amphibacillus sp. Q70]|uniref:PTS sugar transporter subunit IIB n=1 Tax=Amphibacillus sp. Q70 TaxID=3453416 RepID=UPI003F85D202